MNKLKRYSEMIKLATFEERYEYLRLFGLVGLDTFGFDRYMNQKFYKSKEWRDIRDYVIVRDNGCDLGIDGRKIRDRILIHHMNPIIQDDIIHSTDLLLNPDYLVCVSHNTHNAIHYGDSSLLIKEPIKRTKNDTCPWRN